MIAMTTSSSIKVKPRLRSPLMVWHSVQPLGARERVDVVNVIARLRVVRCALVAAQTPGLLGRGRGIGKERVARQAAKKIEILLLLAGGVFDAGVQRFQIRRIAARSELELDVSALRG